jgi:hypothetical protein
MRLLFAPEVRVSEDHRIALRQILTETQKSYPGLGEDKVFERFASEQVLKNDGIELDPEELKEGVTGGGDGGIDAFYLLVNRHVVREDTDLSQFPMDQKLSIEVVVVQSSRQTGFSESGVTKFGDFVRHCLRLKADHSEVRTMYRAELLAKVDKFRQIYGDNLHRRPTTRLRFYYATQGDEIHPKVEFRRTQFMIEMATFFMGVDFGLEFVGAESLLKWFHRQIETTLVLPMNGSAYSRQPASSYVGFVRLRDFYSFITDDGGALREHLFESNVRHFQGFVKVNKEIQTSLKERNALIDFWWLNNGVTIVASDISGDRELLSLTDPLIVNGLQTSFVIHDYFSSDSPVSDERMVMVRVIKAADPATMDAITKATNSQTYIPPSYLHATEDIHRNIETVLRGKDLYYDRRKGYYRRQGVASSQIVTLPYLAQAMLAMVLRRPTDARGRPTAAINRDYAKIFPENGGVDLCVKCAQVMKRVEQFLDTEIDNQATVNDLRFYVAMVVVSQQLQNAAPRRDAVARLDLAAITDNAVRQALFLVRSVYDELGASDTTAKGPEMLKQVEARLQEAFPKRQR